VPDTLPDFFRVWHEADLVLVVGDLSAGVKRTLFRVVLTSANP